jgi:hypothetical protein
VDFLRLLIFSFLGDTLLNSHLQPKTTKSRTISIWLTDTAILYYMIPVAEHPAFPRKIIYAILEEDYVDFHTPFFSNSQSGKTLDTLVYYRF